MGSLTKKGFRILSMQELVGVPLGFLPSNYNPLVSAGFSDVDGYIFPCLSSSCPSAAKQVTDAINGLKAQGATIGRLWLDVEILSWPSSLTSNQKFITDMANTATSMGVQVGVYSNPNNWKAIVGLDWTGVSQYPLWWARYNNAQDLTTGWSAFGGWSAPTIHQYIGDVIESGIRVDKNFK